MNHKLTLLIPATLLIIVGCERSDSATRGGAAEDPVLRAQNQALLNRAMQKARDTIPDFVDSLQDPKPEYSGFAVKKGFPTRDGGTEHIWITELQWDGEVFSGRINNIPANVKGIRMGDRVKVPRDELSDWMYLDGKRVVGGYTLRVLHYEQPKDEQDAFIQETGLEIPPVDF